MTHSVRILIADDDDKFCSAVARHLKRNGHEVYCAGDGFQLLQLAQRVHPDLILVDVNMPAGGGLQMLERMRNITGLTGTPMIMTTGDRSYEVSAEINRLGCDVLWKPFSVTDLMDVIEKKLSETNNEEEDTLFG